MYKHILALTITALTFMTTVGLVQTLLVFAAAPDQGGNPHNQFPNTPIATSSTGDPHSHLAQKGNPHLCETTSSDIGSSTGGAGAGKPSIKQC